MTLRRSGEYHLVASAAGWADAEHTATLDPTAPLEPVDFALTPGGAVAGRVLAPAGASPAGWVVGASRGTPDGRRLSVGADGRFRFEHLTPGPWWIGRMSAEPGPSTISSSDEPVVWEGNCEVREGEVTELDLDFAARELVVLHGSLSVSDGGPPSWEVELFAGERGPFDLDPLDRAAVASDGAFALSAEGAGAYSLTFEHEGDGSRILGYRVVELLAGDNEVELQLDFGRLEGRLELPDPVPPFVALVQEPRDGLRVSLLLPSDDGAFAMRFAWAGEGAIRGAFEPPTSRDAVLAWPVIAEVDVRRDATSTIGP